MCIILKSSFPERHAHKETPPLAVAHADDATMHLPQTRAAQLKLTFKPTIAAFNRKQGRKCTHYVRWSHSYEIDQVLLT